MRPGPVGARGKTLQRATQLGEILGQGAAGKGRGIAGQVRLAWITSQTFSRTNPTTDTSESAK